MKYALISDIHANLPALQAVQTDLSRRSDITAVYHLGDLVGYAPWPNEVVELIAAARIPGIAGNYDSTVGTDYKHCGCRYEDPRQEELSHVSYAWTREHVSPTTKRYLAGFGAGKSSVKVVGSVKESTGRTLATFDQRRIGAMGLGGGDSLGKMMSDARCIGEVIA